MANTIDAFRAALRQAGLAFEGPIHPDGRLRRFKAEGDHARNSWYVLHHGPPAAGAFDCWKRDWKETWCARREQSLLAAERRQFQETRQRIEATQAQAEAAAKAVGAKLVVPQFSNQVDRQTDFNDLHREAGLEESKRQFGTAAVVVETDEEAFARLAGQSPAEYDRAREAEARKLGIRLSTLDRAVRAWCPARRSARVWNRADNTGSAA